MRALLGDAFELVFETKVNTVTYDSVEDYWQDFAQNYGPTKSLYESLGDRGEEMHQAWLARVRRPTPLHTRAPVPRS